jgi:hypothetical protein
MQLLLLLQLLLPLLQLRLPLEGCPEPQSS